MDTLAREALPLALQETAGDGMGDRLGAFGMGQIGGRSVEPREAAVRSGDLQVALTEITALPEGAQGVLAPWAAWPFARRSGPRNTSGGLSWRNWSWRRAPRWWATARWRPKPREKKKGGSLAPSEKFSRKFGLGLRF